MRAHSSVVIADTTGFDGTYIIESVEDEYITIQTTAGISIPAEFGTASNYLNYYFSNYQLAEELDIRLHYDALSQAKKLPLLVCFSNIEEDRQDESMYSANVRMAILHRTDTNVKNIDRYEDVFVYLRRIVKDLERAIETTKGIVSSQYTKTEIPFEGQNDDFKSKIEESTDVIELNYQLNYFYLSQC
jgi:hypothetical protein